MAELGTFYHNLQVQGDRNCIKSVLAQEHIHPCAVKQVFPVCSQEVYPVCAWDDFCQHSQIVSEILLASKHTSRGRALARYGMCYKMLSRICGIETDR
jgi:hypothetical protein